MEKLRYLRLTVPNDKFYLRLVLTFFKEAAMIFGCSETDSYKIEVAIEEAITNVIEHAYEANESSTFDVICEGIPGGVKMIIKEKGLPYDPKRQSQYNPDAELDEQSARGMGLFLMRELMDEVHFLNLGAEGKETLLILYFKDQAAITEQDISEEEKAIDEQEVIEGKINYDVRLMEPSDAIEISKCAYKSHGYSFFDDHIYYPDHIIEMNQTGEMISAVAVTPDNVFMGHGALHYPYPGARIAELTFLFVNVEYRGQGCMNRVCDFLYTTPKQHPLAGIYTYAVTNHLFTQKIMVRMGVKDCGIILASSPATWQFKGIVGESAQRISVVLSFKYLDAAVPRTLYPPVHHKEMIEKLYRNIGATHDFVTSVADTRLPDDPSDIETTLFDSEECAEIMVRHYGAQVLQEVRRILRDLCVRKIAAIQLMLPLEDPATCFMTKAIEDLGFFFSSILPRESIGDVLVLQYLNNVPFDYAKVMVHTEIAAELLAYIHERDPYANL
jgi:anti-sigma regulatory factor (Ser/Thr protein kinase)